jgi:hypothetical protein
MSTIDSPIEAFADEICKSSDKKSPFAFVSSPDEPKQRFAGLRKRRLEFGTFEVEANHLPEVRAALIAALRHRGRTVSDVGNGLLMSRALKAMYGKSGAAAVSMGLDVPHVLKQALLTRIAENEAPGNSGQSDE